MYIISINVKVAFLLFTIKNKTLEMTPLIRIGCLCIKAVWILGARQIYSVILKRVDTYIALVLTPDSMEPSGILSTFKMNLLPLRRLKKINKSSDKMHVYAK